MENFHSILNAAHKSRQQKAMNSRICFHILVFCLFCFRPFIIFLLTKQKSLTIYTNLRRSSQIISEYVSCMTVRKMKDFQS